MTSIAYFISIVTQDKHRGSAQRLVLGVTEERQSPTSVSALSPHLHEALAYFMT